MMFLIWTAVVAVSTSVDPNHPAVKIISLLEKLSAQVKDEGNAEAADYATFQYWCTDTQKKQQEVIDEMDERILTANSNIEALNQDIDVLNNEINLLETEISTDEAAKTQAETDRNAGNREFIRARNKLQSTIQAVGTALTALQGTQGLTQVDKHVDDAVKRAFALSDVAKAQEAMQLAAEKSFLQRQAPAVDNDVYDNRTGRVGTYEYKSGGVVETLSQLKKKFYNDLDELSRAEQNNQKMWQAADQAKQDEITAATTAKGTKEFIEGRKQVQLTGSTRTLRQSTNTKTNAATALKTTKNTCNQKADEWKERSERREGEIKAMKAAVEVLEKVANVRSPSDKGVNVQYTGFLQFSDPKAKIVNLLRKAAKASKAKQLEQLADAISVVGGVEPIGSGPFDQIKNMIEKMIFQLMSEQKDEDDHKNWCDVETAKSTKMKEDKETRESMLDTDIGSLKADVKRLTRDISKNTRDIADLLEQMQTQKEQREKDHKENTATIKDAEDAQAAVDKAIVTLTEFYKSTGEVQKEAWEFTQTKKIWVPTQPDKMTPTYEPEPSTWTSNSPYTGVQGGSGVITMLENIASDFGTMEAEARSDETTQQNTFDDWMTASVADKAAMEQDSVSKTAQKQTMEMKLSSKEKDAQLNSRELDQVYQYLKDLGKPCRGGASSYDERKAARAQEITALHQAQDILQDAFNA